MINKETYDKLYELLQDKDSNVYKKISEIGHIIESLPVETLTSIIGTRLSRSERIVKNTKAFVEESKTFWEQEKDVIRTLGYALDKLKYVLCDRSKTLYVDPNIVYSLSDTSQWFIDRKKAFKPDGTQFDKGN